MSKYAPLHVHSHYSLLDGLSQPKHIFKRLVDTGITTCALTDHGSISGCVTFVKQMKDLAAELKEDTGQEVKIKPILGCELYISPTEAVLKDKDNAKTNHLVVLAKNLAGWQSLIQAVSTSNSPDHFYHKPRLDRRLLSEFAKDGNLIAFSGHMGSHMSDILFTEPKLAFNAKTEAEARGLLKPDWQKQASMLANQYIDIFGKDNFFLEIQLIDRHFLPAQTVISECLRKVAHAQRIRTLATPDAHYSEREQAIDQQVLLCANLNTTIGAVNAKIASDEDVMLGGFFKSDNYHIPSSEEMEALHTKEELDNTLLVAEMCESYDILGKPMLPPFPCPSGMDEAQYLRQLCRDGWQARIQNKVHKDQHPIYAERVKHELDVLQGAGLSGYFLILNDIVKFVRSNGWMVGPGRGSAAGSLVSYLTTITSIDPIPYDLLFERFYNPGRNTKDRVSYPDIDLDIPVQRREDVIAHIKKRFGDDKVGQMVSYQTIKGRGALQAVFRAYGGITHDEVTKMTKFIPEEAKIAGDLQEMKKEFGESSIIRWALENDGAKFKDWCHIDDKGNLQGPLSKRFEQAIRLEGTKYSASKHAAGIVISPTPLAGICPMIRDSKTNQIAGFEMNDLEAIGLIKLDILGLAFLDKVQGVQDILATGDILS